MTAMPQRSIPLMSPLFKEADIQAVTDVLRSGMLVQGKQVAALEAEMCAYTGAEHAIAVSNGTATLHLALLALGIGPGDEVIVPALSYVATANVVELVGATPIFVDVTERTFNIDTTKIEAAITPRTKAIIPVHEFGLAAEISRVMELAAAHKLHVIEDAACALGAREGEQHVGTSGDFGSFSFHPRKAITSGEGGMLLTNDAAKADYLRMMRNHGIVMDGGAMEFEAAGFNYRMTDFQAALVLSQMGRADEGIAYKRELADIYYNELDSALLTLPMEDAAHPHTWQSFHVLLDDRIDRAQLIKDLGAQGIGANYGAQCIPAVRFYQRKYALDAASLFPNAYRAYTKGLVLPLYEKLSREEVAYVASAINQTLQQHAS